MTKKTRYSQSSMGWNKYQNSSVMKKILSNKKISEQLDLSSERTEFYDAMKKKAEGGVTNDEMREIFGDLVRGKGRTISRKEAYEIAKEFFPDEKRYKFTNGAGNLSTDNAPSRPGQSNQNVQIPPSGKIPEIKTSQPAGLAASVSTMKARGVDSDVRRGNGFKGAKKGISYFDALKATSKNKE